MTITNEELVRKTITAADALASSGKLNDAQSDRFIDYVIDETSLKNNVRIVRFRNENMNIDKVGIGTRVAVPKNEARDPGIRRGITTSKITLTPAEIMVPAEISDNFKELNIEGDNFEDHAIRMFATQLANDMEELYIIGDQNGPAVLEGDIIDNGSSTQYVKDSYLALQDGWQLLADSGNVVDAEGTNIGFSVFSDAIKAMPTKFRRNKKNLRWFMSPDLAQTYAERLTTRATMAGDEAGRGMVMQPFGIKLVEVPLWDFNSKVVEHVVLSGTTAVTLKYKNITSVIVLPNTLSDTPSTPYISGTDYTLDATAGTIARDAGGSIGDGDTVKVTYLASPQLLLTHMSNFIIGIGRDIRIEKDRDIYKSVDQFAITAKISCQIEEPTAIVKVKNIGEGV
jgi:hypothetical protein